MQLEIKNNTAIVASPEIDEKTVFVKKLMGEYKTTDKLFVENLTGLKINGLFEHGNCECTLCMLIVAGKNLRIINVSEFLTAYQHADTSGKILTTEEGKILIYG